MFKLKDPGSWVKCLEFRLLGLVSRAMRSGGFRVAHLVAM